VKLREEYVKLNSSTRAFKLPFPILGLTGGIATGKSTVARFLRSRGLPLIDADLLIKRIYQSPETKQFISQSYPEAIKDQEIQFPVLREVFFNSPEAKKSIEAHLSLSLPTYFHEELQKLGKIDILIYDVPLLFERKLETKVDQTVVVYAPRETQIARLLHRDGGRRELAEKILDHQMDIEEKKKRADILIDNSRTEAELIIDLENFLKKYFI
jgi:dephospho-CoA kinase